MTEVRWHINSLGVIGKCNAKNRECPFGGDSFHFPTKEQAQKYADMNSEIYAKSNLEPSSEEIFHNSGLNPTSGYKNIKNLLSQAQARMNAYNERVKNEWEMTDKSITLNEYQKMSRSTKEYKKLKAFKKMINKQARRFEAERKLVEEFKKSLYAEDVVHQNYSTKSSSSYLYLDSSSFNYVEEKLSELGFKFTKRPDAEKYLGNYYEVRFGNHEPPEYQVDPDNYWLTDNRPTFLVEFPNEVDEVNFGYEDMLEYLEKMGTKKVDKRRKRRYNKRNKSKGVN